MLNKKIGWEMAFGPPPPAQEIYLAVKLQKD
jgi:hypothetical protein